MATIPNRIQLRNMKNIHTELLRIATFLLTYRIAKYYFLHRSTIFVFH